MSRIVVILMLSLLLTACTVPPALPVAPATEPVPTATSIPAAASPSPVAPSPTVVPTAPATATASPAPTSVPTPAASPTRVPAERLTADSQTTSEKIREHMAQSHDHWQTIFADGTYLIYPAPGSSEAPTRIHVQAWISGTTQARVLTGLAGQPPETLSTSAGQEVVTTNLATGDSNSTPLERADALALATALGSPLVQHLLPGSFAGCGGVYMTMQSEPVAGRAAVVVEWTPPADPTCMPAAKTRYWTDAETGVLLRSVQYDGEKIVSDIYVNFIAYDPAIPAGYFTPGTGEKTDFVPVPAPTAGQTQRFDRPEAGFSVDVPAAWQVLDAGRTALGIQLIMGPPPLSLVAGQAAPVQIAVADSAEYTVSQVLEMAYAGLPAAPGLEAVTLPNGVAAKHVKLPATASKAGYVGEAYLIEHGAQLMLVAIDPAAAGVSVDQFFGSFRLTDIKAPEAPSPVTVTVSPVKGGTSDVFTLRVQGQAGQELTYQILAEGGQAVAGEQIKLDAMGEWPPLTSSTQAGRWTPGASVAPGLYFLRVSAAGGPPLGEALFEITR